MWFSPSRFSARRFSKPTAWPSWLTSSFLTSVSEIDIVGRKLRPDLGHQAQRHKRADEGHQQSQQLSQQNDLAVAKFPRLELGVQCRQSFQGAVRIDLDLAQPGHLGAGQHERAGE